MNRLSAIDRGLFSGLIVVASVAYASASWSDEQSEAARLFEEGRALMVEGRFAEACPRLAESQRLEPRGGTQLNLAVCHERQGKIGRAWVELQEALITARTDGGHPEREKLAAERIAVIEPRLPWLTVRLAGGGARDVTVQIDGATIAPMALGKEMPADPGEHRVSVMEGGRVIWEQTVTLAEAEHATIAIPLTAPPPPQAPQAPAQAPAPTMPAPTMPAEAPWKGRWVFEVGLLGGGFWADMTNRHATSTDEGVLLRRLSGAGPAESTCASEPCVYTPLPRSGVLYGVQGFVGYAPQRHLHLGARISTALMSGSDGVLVTIGPAASARVAGPLWIGGSLLVGLAIGTAEATVTPHPDYATIGPPTTYVPAWTGPSPGASLELGLSLLERPGGSLMVEATPLFFASPLGHAFALPVSLAYRWH